MNLDIKNELFIVCGATSGFGKSVALALLAEGASVILNARGSEKLQELQIKWPDQVEIEAGDVTSDAVISKLIRRVGNRKLSGVLINAGGPPAKSFVTTEMADWDNAYERILRWKVKFTHALLPVMHNYNYGRIVYIESVSVKQPIENLVLSNSLRLAVVGFVKTLSQEIASQGITLNILAPGYHATPAMQRLFENKSILLGISVDEAKSEFERETKMGILGDPDDLGSLAAWLLSPHSRYITGQTISIDGGLMKGTF